MSDNFILAGPNNTVEYNCFDNINNTGAPAHNVDGNIRFDPLFVDPSNNNFHLTNVSPCIDAGDPADDDSNEPQPSVYINMGAYGNTSEATMNTLWTKDMNIPKDVTVPSGIILTINDGVTLTFEGSGKIINYGTLDVQGNPSSKITFTRSGSSGSWYGLKNYGTANINHAIVEYAYRGLRFYQNSSGTVSNSQIRNNAYGIYAYKSHPNIQNCEIIDNTNRGIYFYSGNYTSGCAQILNNQIHDNNYYGIDLSQSSPDIRGNNIYNNDYGVACATLSSPYLGQYDLYGDNQIHNNDYGLEAFDISNPFLGQENCIKDGGRNSFESNTYHVRAEMDCYLMAEENWWGANPPPASKFIEIESTVDRTPALDGDPFGSMALAKGSPESAAFDSAFSEDESDETVKDFMSYFNPKWNIEQKLLFARNIYHLGDLKNSQSICKDIMENFPDSSLAQFALDILWESSRDEKAQSGYDLKAFESYLTKLSGKEENKPLYIQAELSLAGFNVEKALSTFGNVYSANKGNNLAESALFHEFMYYFNIDNMEDAKQIADQLEKEYPKSISSRKAISHFSSMPPVVKKELSHDAAAIIPSKYAIGANYPNPFNPETRITYQVPKQSRVKFTIYNSLGQIVRSVKEDIREKGLHTFLWNGKNDSSQNMSSGLYILMFSAKSLEDDNETFSKSIKLLLVR